MIVVAALVTGFGLIAVLTRKSLLGVLIGIQVMFSGSVLAVVAGGLGRSNAVPEHGLAVILLASLVVPFGMGMAVVVRSYFLSGNVSFEKKGDK